MNAAAELYLDTARLGRMKRSAQRAVSDFARLASEVPLTLYGRNFLLDGVDALPDNVGRRLRGLSSWSGVAGLKRDLLGLTQVPKDRDCMLASRSMMLLKSAAAELARRRVRVLVPDVVWPCYLKAMAGVLANSDATLVELPLREHLLAGDLPADALVDIVVKEFCAQRCDAAFLTAVSHDGIRLPVDTIARRLRQVAPPAVVLADSSQALGHVADEIGLCECDFVLSGVHKWVRAGLPLGVAIGSREFIEKVRPVTAAADPLAAFSSSNRKRAGAIDETINVWPLISCAAALGDISPARKLPRKFAGRLANADRIARLLDGTGWKTMRPHASLRSGILLARPEKGGRRPPCPERTRRHFESLAISLTVYPGPAVRLALPARPLSTCNTQRLHDAFSTIGGGFTEKD